MYLNSLRNVQFITSQLQSKYNHHLTIHQGLCSVILSCSTVPDAHGRKLRKLLSCTSIAHRLSCPHTITTSHLTSNKDTSIQTAELSTRAQKGYGNQEAVCCREVLPSLTNATSHVRKSAEVKQQTAFSSGFFLSGQHGSNTWRGHTA